MKPIYSLILAVSLLAAGCTSETPVVHEQKQMIELAPAVSRAGEQNSMFKYSILEAANSVESEEYGNENIFISPLTLSMNLTGMANSMDTEYLRTFEQNVKTLDRIYQVLGSKDLESLNVLMRSYVDAIPNLENATKADIFSILIAPDFSDHSGEEYDILKGYFEKDSTFYADVLRADVVRNGAISDEKHQFYTELFGKLNIDFSEQLYKETDLFFNILDFKSAWAEKFDKSNTHKAVFHGADADVSIDMMAQTGSCKYAANDKMKVIKKPFGNGTFEFVAVLPRDGGDIDELIDSGELRNMEELDFSERTLRIELPRLDVNTGSVRISYWLEAMGVTPVVVLSSDPMGPCRIMDFRSNMCLCLNEDGAEVQTSTLSYDTAWAVLPGEFVCDRPFVMMVNLAQTGVSLITAKIASMK